MKKFIETVARALVDHPAEVEVSEFDEDNSIILELQVDEEDLGKVIGKRGRTAQAMRTLLGVAGAKDGSRYVLEILD